MYEILPKMEHLSSLMFWRQGGQTCPIEPKISDLNCVTAPSEDDLKLLHHTTIITTPPDIGQSINSKEETVETIQKNGIRNITELQYREKRRSIGDVSVLYQRNIEIGNESTRNTKGKIIRQMSYPTFLNDKNANTENVSCSSSFESSFEQFESISSSAFF